MNKNTRVVLVVVLLMVLPLLFYALLQVRSLANDEQVLNEIYEKQMETILFSLNQFADDTVDRWVRQLADEKNTVIKNATGLILENESIQMLVLRQMSTQNDRIFTNDYVQLDSTASSSIKNWYAGKDSVMNQLSKYLDAGFQKIQASEDWVPITGLDEAQSAMTIMLYDQSGELYNALIILQTAYWVEQVLGLKMKELAQDKLRISVM